MTVVDPSSAAPVVDPSSLVVLVVDVPGVPVPQGSKRARLVRGRIVMYEANASLEAWRRVVQAHAEARRRRCRWWPLDGPCAVDLTFWLPRPKAAGKRRYPSVAPDIDKMCRAILDSFTKALIFTDDSRVVDLTARKRYAVNQPGVRARIVDLSNQPTLDGGF